MLTDVMIAEFLTNGRIALIALGGFVVFRLNDKVLFALACLCVAVVYGVRYFRTLV